MAATPKAGSKHRVLFGIGIGIGLALVVGAAWLWRSQARSVDVTGNGFTDMTSTKQVVTGSILENNLGCRVNAACYLRLRTTEGEVRVVYHYGEWPPCTNGAVAQAGQLLRVGDHVEVYGHATLLNGLHLVTTCDSLDYYIRKL